MAAVRTVDQVKWTDGLDQHIISLLLKAVEENNGFIPSQYEISPLQHPACLTPESCSALSTLDKMIKWPEDAEKLIPATKHNDREIRVRANLISFLSPLPS